MWTIEDILDECNKINTVIEKYLIHGLVGQSKLRHQVSRHPGFFKDLFKPAHAKEASLLREAINKIKEKIESSFVRQSSKDDALDIHAARAQIESLLRPFVNAEKSQPRGGNILSQYLLPSYNTINGLEIAMTPLRH